MTERPGKKTPTALLILDLQEAFLKIIEDRKALVRRCCFAAEAATLLDWPVIVTEQEPEKLGPVVPALGAVTSGVEPIAKSAFSALKEPAVKGRLRELGVKHVLVAGLETHICVYQTVVDALRNGLGVTLLTDCISCRRPEDASAVIRFLSAADSCHLLPSETVFYSTLETAEAPAFRAYTKLVKEYG